MLSVNGISAWIEVDGKELEQYGVEEYRDQGRVTCWIATQADKCFSVAFRDDATRRDHSLASNLRLDGSLVNGQILRPPTSFSNRALDRTIVQKNHVLSVTSSRPFMFSKLELTDDDEYLNQVTAHLGEIQIDIFRVHTLGSHIFQSDSSVFGHGKVHERSKKAVTHCVSYGQEVKTEIQHVCRVMYLDGITPLATFIFKYRDTGLLQANGIIPIPPRPKKRAVVSEEILDLTSNDVKPEPAGDIEIIDGAIQKKASPSKRLKPGCESEARPAKRIKREKKAVPTSEVIDLT